MFGRRADVGWKGRRNGAGGSRGGAGMAPGRRDRAPVVFAGDGGGGGALVARVRAWAVGRAAGGVGIGGDGIVCRPHRSRTGELRWRSAGRALKAAPPPLVLMLPLVHTARSTLGCGQCGSGCAAGQAADRLRCSTRASGLGRVADRRAPPG
ncbi:hypothetical protein PLESTM_001463000 [Pleodorina starrii]|nr:hypothetical protein PLESTM_001463000 [Pleodorina starrii]